MEQKVKWSRYAWEITVLVTIALVATLVITRNTEWRFNTVVGVTAIVFISMWIWSPTSISVDDEFITIHKRIGQKRIPINDVTRIVIIEPEIERGFRLCGSGGFAGYYGWFHDSRIGRYFGYSGNRHECFLVQLKSGKQYILGCENASEMVNYISKQIK
ncbi:MAG: PH domain-containing protein [Muribaculum sp.]|nr:PH domain-containing protein [Muribaculum sp.]